MADEELVIKVKFDNTDAMAKQKAIDAGADAVTAKVDASVKKIAAAQKKAAETQFVSLGKVQLAGVKLADKLAAEAKRAADVQAAEAKKAADRQIAEAERAGRGQFVSMGSVQLSAVKLYDRIAAEAKKSADKQIAEAKKAADAQAAAQKKAFDSTFVSLGSLQQSGLKLQDKLTAAAKKTADAQWSVAGAIQGVATASFAIGAATKVFDYFYNRFEGMRNSVIGSVKELAEMRMQVLGLADLNDRLGNTTKETQVSLEFRAKTLQSREQATQFQEAIKNTGQASIGRKISQSEFDALAVKGGQFQAASGGGATPLGELMGALPSLMKTAPGQMLSAGDVFAKQQQINEIMKKGGSSPTSGTTQLLKTSALSSAGLFRDISQQAALQSAYSLKAPESAGTLVEQFTRATVGGLGRMRGSGVEGDEKQMEYLKSIGATDQMDPIEIGKLVSADMKNQEQQAAAGGKTFNPYAYLGHHGYQDQETKMSLMQFHAINQSGELGMFEGMAAQAPNAAPAEDAIKKFQATSPTAGAMRNQVAGDLASTTQAAGAPEYYQQLKVLAYERLRADKNSGVYGKAGVEGLKEWESGWFGWIDGSRAKIVDESRKILEEQGKAAGVRVGVAYDAHSGKELRDYSSLTYDIGQSEESRAKEFYKQAQLLGTAGGNPNAGLETLVTLAKKQLEATERTEKLMRDGQNRQPIPVVQPGGANAGRAP